MLRPAVLLVCLAALAGGCKKSGPMEEFESKEWKFKAKFPGKPETKSQSAPVPGVGAVQLHMFLIEERTGAFTVNVSDLPIPAALSPAEVESSLDGARDGAIKNISGTLQSSAPVKLQGKYPGRDFTAKFTRGTSDLLIRARVYLAGNRQYQIMVLGNAAFMSDARVTEFFDSFQIVDGSAPVAAAGTGGAGGADGFESKEWKFRAKYPGAGKPEAGEAAGPYATRLKAFTQTVPQGSYSVGAANLPFPESTNSADAVKRLDEAQTAFTVIHRGTVESSAKGLLQGKYQGRDMVFKLPAKGKDERVARVRVFLVGKRVYQLSVTGPAAFANDEAATEFLNSFEVVE